MVVIDVGIFTNKQGDLFAKGDESKGDERSETYVIWNGRWQEHTENNLIHFK